MELGVVVVYFLFSGAGGKSASSVWLVQRLTMSGRDFVGRDFEFC